MKILICGLNGVGKSTLGRALAARLGYPLVDAEDLYFPKTNPDYPYAEPRSRAEAEALLAEIMDTREDLVFSAVRGDYGEATVHRYTLAVVVQAPRSIRLTRVHDRSFARFGHRMEKGGDLWEQEQAFLSMVSSRDEAYVTDWVKTLHCPVLFVDGTRPIEETVDYLTASMEGIRPYLAEQMRIHPAMAPQDIAKLCYQAAHGAEHLLSDLDRARAYFMAEWNATPPDGTLPLTEAISDTVARVNLAAWKAQGLAPASLFDLFAATASISGGGDARLLTYLSEAEDWLTRVPTSIPSEEWQAFTAWYAEKGYPAIHHSEAYRKAEGPAYRIVLRRLLWETGMA